MQNDKHQRPARTAGDPPPTDDKLGPAKGIANAFGFLFVFAVLFLLAGVILSAGVWAIVAMWGAIL